MKKWKERVKKGKPKKIIINTVLLAFELVVLSLKRVQKYLNVHICPFQLILNDSYPNI